jgi:hypothetical protein
VPGLVVLPRTIAAAACVMRRVMRRVRFPLSTSAGLLDLWLLLGRAPGNQAVTGHTASGGSGFRALSITPASGEERTVKHGQTQITASTNTTRASAQLLQSSTITPCAM